MQFCGSLRKYQRPSFSKLLKTYHFILLIENRDSNIETVRHHPIENLITPQKYDIVLIGVFELCDCFEEGCLNKLVCELVLFTWLIHNEKNDMAITIDRNPPGIIGNLYFKIGHFKWQLYLMNDLEVHDLNDSNFDILSYNQIYLNNQDNEPVVRHKTSIRENFIVSSF